MAARQLTGTVLALLACVPLAGMLTLAAWPVFGWFEARTGIEALGHSGPASWCYFAVLLACWAAVAAWRRGRRRGG